MSDNGSIFISAGDPSADYPGKNLIAEIRRACPHLDPFGLGGPLMQQAGLQPLADYRDLAVLGFWEIVPKFFFFRTLMNRTVKEISRRRPRAVILIDYPGFNLRLARRIKPLGIPIVYYISPQVWAWGKRRIAAIKELVDVMLVIFPFEENFYRDHDIKAFFTGHPIADRYRDIPDAAACREKLGFAADSTLIALLPGSRTQEIKRNFPAMAAASDSIRRKLDNVEFIIAGTNDLDARLYADIIRNRPLSFRQGVTPEIINAADFVIVSSGTATVEVAYFTTPMLIVYKTGFLTYQIARRLVDLDVIGMTNIIAGRKIVPELIQRDASPEAITRETVRIMNDRPGYDRMVSDLHDVRRQLGPGDAARRAFDLIVREVGPLC